MQMEKENEKELVKMGFSQVQAKAAVAALPQGNVDQLVDWIFANNNDIVFDNDDNNGDYLDINDDDDEDDGGGGDNRDRRSKEMKLVNVVRKDLNMSAGKVAAQCVHASLECVRRAKKQDLIRWEDGGEPVIVLVCDDEAEMKRLYATAVANKLIVCIQTDAGRTEVESGTNTVLAIGPHENGKIDAITKHLRLFK